VIGRGALVAPSFRRTRTPSRGPVPGRRFFHARQALVVVGKESSSCASGTARDNHSGPGVNPRALLLALAGGENLAWGRVLSPERRTAAPLDWVSVSLATIELKLEGGHTLLMFTEAGAFFDGLDSPTRREQGMGWLLDALARALEGDARTADDRCARHSPVWPRMRNRQWSPPSSAGPNLGDVPRFGCVGAHPRSTVSDSDGSVTRRRIWSTAHCRSCGEVLRSL